MPVIIIVTLRKLKDFKIHQNSSGKILQIFFFHNYVILMLGLLKDNTLLQSISERKKQPLAHWDSKSSHDKTAH